MDENHAQEAVTPVRGAVSSEALEKNQPVPVQDILAGDDLVRMDQVRYAYPGGKGVLGGITLGLQRNEIIAVVGPSGCGKSTLLRLIAGFIEADHGTIQVAPAENGRHGCAMLFQEDTLLPWMRVKDNASLFDKFQRRHGVKSKGSGETVTQLLQMVGLDSVLDLYPYQLSGGMKRRLAVVAAVASLPQLLLLDEPFSALDEPTRISIHGEVYSVLRRYGIGSILVTHDIAEAICLSDRVLVLSKTPSVVAKEFVVDFGAERDMMALRSSPEFLELYGELWEALRRVIVEG
jgi:NitT/TauT family transport system ATP-binding protein